MSQSRGSSQNVAGQGAVAQLNHAISEGAFVHEVKPQPHAGREEPGAAAHENE